MNVTVTVENDVIKLPPGVHVPNGTQVEITLPEEQQEDRTAWLAQSERRLREVWNNDADDVYNELLA